jgi:hypothetical protein
MPVGRDMAGRLVFSALCDSPSFRDPERRAVFLWARAGLLADATVDIVPGRGYAVARRAGVTTRHGNRWPFLRSDRCPAATPDTVGRTPEGGEWRNDAHPGALLE